MATYVIQAPGTEEFADGLRMEVLEAADVLGAAVPILGSISNRPGGAGWSWVECGCQPNFRPNSNLLGSTHWW